MTIPWVGHSWSRVLKCPRSPALLCWVFPHAQTAASWIIPSVGTHMPAHSWGTRHFVLLNLQFECPYVWCSVSIAQPHVTTVIMDTLCLIYNTEISVKDLAFYIRVGLYNIALSILQYQEISARFSVLLKENYFLLCFYLQSSGIKSPKHPQNCFLCSWNALKWVVGNKNIRICFG